MLYRNRFRTRIIFQSNMKDADPAFVDEISSLAGVTNLQTCIQCGTCSGTCPSTNTWIFPAQNHQPDPWVSGRTCLPVSLPALCIMLFLCCGVSSDHFHHRHDVCNQAKISAGEAISQMVPFSGNGAGIFQRHHLTWTHS